MLTVFEVLPDDTVRARVFTDWMTLELRYRDKRCTVAEMVEVLPEGGEGGHWRLERRVYRDVEVPRCYCHGVIGAAAYPNDCKIGGTYRREVGGRLEAHVITSLHDGDGGLCPLSQFDMPFPLLALSAYLRDGITTVGIVDWKGIERVDVREWETWFDGGKNLAAWLRRVIASYGAFLTAPPEATMGAWFHVFFPDMRRKDEVPRVWVDLHHDLVYLDISISGRGCAVNESSEFLMERRDGEYVLRVRGGGDRVPRHLCDALMDRLLYGRCPAVWGDASDEEEVEGYPDGTVYRDRHVYADVSFKLADCVYRGVMDLPRAMYAVHLAAAGLPVRTIDGEDVDGWPSRHPPRDWVKVVVEEARRRAGRYKVYRRA